MVLDNNNHSVFVLMYRLILPTNMLTNVITSNISKRLKDIFESISENYNITLLKWNYSSCYLDITFKAHPNSELTKFINAYKSAGSRLIKKEFPIVNAQINDGQFWKKSFCLLTLGDEKIIPELIELYLKKINK